MVCWRAPNSKTRAQATFFARETLKFLSSFPVWHSRNMQIPSNLLWSTVNTISLSILNLFAKKQTCLQKWCHSPSYQPSKIQDIFFISVNIPLPMHLMRLVSWTSMNEGVCPRVLQKTEQTIGVKENEIRWWTPEK